MARKCNPGCAFGEGHDGPCSTDPAPVASDEQKVAERCVHRKDLTVFVHRGPVHNPSQRCDLDCKAGPVCIGCLEEALTPAFAAAVQQAREDALKTVLDYILTIEAELRRVALQEAEWWHKRCCERVEVIGQPGVFQCFGCERIAALEHAAKEEKR